MFAFLVYTECFEISMGKQSEECSPLLLHGMLSSSTRLLEAANSAANWYERVHKTSPQPLTCRSGTRCQALDTSSICCQKAIALGRPWVPLLAVLSTAPGLPRIPSQSSQDFKT